MSSRALRDPVQKHSVQDAVAESSAQSTLLVGEDDFRRMIDVDALNHASAFIAEETAIVADVVAGLAVQAECSMVVVGGAGSTHLAVPANVLRRCVVVDPLGLNSWDPPIKYVSTVHLRALHEVNKSELPASPLLWVFTFNVFPYLREPIEVLRRLASPRDTVVVTTWASTVRAATIRSGYLEHVFGGKQPRMDTAIDVGQIAGDLRLVQPGARVECVHGEVVDAAVVYPKAT